MAKKSAPAASAEVAANTTAPSLKLLAEDKAHETGVSKSTIFRVDPDRIKFEPGFNLRTEGDELDLHIDRLTAAMLAGAFIPPVDVTVANGVITARDGHCRTRAAQRVKKTMPEFTIECRQLRGNDADAVLHMLGTGAGQMPLTPLEQGRGYLRLINMGLTAQAIADRLGVSRVTIDNGLTLAEAPAEVQQMVANGEVSSTTAREVIKQGPAAVQALKDTVQAERENPTPTKGGKASKKKKVTAKKLRGTAADKNAKKGSKKAPAAPAAPEAPQDPTPVVSNGDVQIVTKREIAQAGLSFVQSNAPDDDEALRSFMHSLELALM